MATKEVVFSHIYFTIAQSQGLFKHVIHKFYAWKHNHFLEIPYSEGIYFSVAFFMPFLPHPFVLLFLWCETTGVLFLKSLSKVCFFGRGSGILGSGLCQWCNSELCFPVKCCLVQNSNTEQKPNQVETYAALQTRRHLTYYKDLF